MLFIVTFRFRTTELPQVLFAITLIVPPRLPEVTVILFVVLLPLHPEGKLQV